MKNEIIVLDIETTGFNEREDLILELGIVKLNTETGEITELFDEVFKSPKLKEKHKKAWIFVNGYMNPNELKDAKPFSEYKDEIQAILDPFKGYITAWNRDFDSKFLRANGVTLGDSPGCPMKVSTNHFKIKKPRGNGYKWATAQEAWDRMFPKVKKIEEHRGLDDSIMEAKIIYNLIQEGVYTPFSKL